MALYNYYGFKAPGLKYRNFYFTDVYPLIVSLSSAQLLNTER